MKKAHIISIGNELLIGDTVNTNASWIGRFLTEAGFEIERVFTLPDNYDTIKQFIKQSVETADFTVVTGGLGPTHDDITKKAVADVFDCYMVKNDQVLSHIKDIFERRGFRMSESNIEQADVPTACEVLFNKMGTAPGLWFEKNQRYLAVLPGVPHEMKYLMSVVVSPKLKQVFPGLEVWVTEYFKTVGIPESTLSDKIGSLDEFMNNGVEVAYLPGPAGVTIRVRANGADQIEAEGRLREIKKNLNEKISSDLYGKGKNLRLAEVLGKILTEKRLTIAVAESCTGGQLADEITDIPGSSNYMKGGVIAYANNIKTSILNVDEDVLKRDGAVSKSVALQMAKGVADLMGADIGVSTTGIAGPGGGTKEKPVGLVWMGFWIKDNHFALQTIFTSNRLINKKRTVMVVLESVRRHLLGIGSYPYELKPHSP